jgi:uncharacterized membrane protein
MQTQTVTCDICHRELPRHRCSPASALRPTLSGFLRKTHLGWNQEGFICHQDMNTLRTEFVASLLASEKGELARMEKEVLNSIDKEELLARKLRKESQGFYTLGQRMADKVARFGGSWTFLGAFALFIFAWMLSNAGLALFLRDRPFDPFPYVLLNLLLSCLASVQGPIIMMSQNLQAARDRLDAENDYKVNLKAELEIRNLHEKMDHLLEHQWQYLLEVQQIQIELMEEIARRKA